MTVDRLTRWCAAAVAAGVLVLTSACTAAPVEPVPTPSATPSRAIASDRRLREAADGRLPRGADPAESLVWTTARTTPDGAAVDMTGKDLLLVAACDGGGTISVRVSGTPDRVLRCDGLQSIGPVDVSAALGTDPPGSAQFDVQASAGHPHYFAQAATIDEDAAR